MSTYIHFTEEQKQRAAAVDLEEFLRFRGEKLIPSGREKRLAKDHSVTVRGNEWYDHAEEKGGHAVSFVQRFYNLSYPEAMTMLLGGEVGTIYPSATERVEEPPKPFVLPPIHSDMRRVYAYLVKHRNIDRSVVAHFAREKLLYEDAKYHNAVFVGTDEESIPRHAHKRSTNSYGKAFRLNVEGCDPRYSFHHMGTDESLFVFEAPIDMSKEIEFKNRDRFVQLGIAISALRKMRGLSQEQLAEKANVSRSHISSIEAPGIVRPFSLEVFFNIADALEIGPADLISASVFPDKIINSRKG